MQLPSTLVRQRFKPKRLVRACEDPWLVRAQRQSLGSLLPVNLTFVTYDLADVDPQVAAADAPRIETPRSDLLDHELVFALPSLGQAADRELLWLLGFSHANRASPGLQVYRRGVLSGKLRPRRTDPAAAIPFACIASKRSNRRSGGVVGR